MQHFLVYVWTISGEFLKCSKHFKTLKNLQNIVIGVWIKTNQIIKSNVTHKSYTSYTSYVTQ